MNVDFQSIYGFQVGFEIADTETCEMTEISWGLSIDLGFVRMVVSG
jgi:hypothetical protein